MVADLDPKITVKSRGAYIKKLDKIVIKEVIPDVKQTLQGLKQRYCHFSCDVWSTKRREGVLGILCHWVSTNWTLCSTIIGFKRLTERHKAEYCKQQFLSCLREMEFPTNWVRDRD